MTEASLAEITETLALSKAREIAPEAPQSIIVGADTLVAINGHILGKPSGPEEAEAMLMELSGRTHQVVTGLAVVDTVEGRQQISSETSAATMRPYSAEEALRYVASGEPLDKAGAYAVQDASFKPATRVEGCYLNVVGLPLCSLIKILRRFGVETEHRFAEMEPGDCGACRDWEWREGK